MEKAKSKKHFQQLQEWDQAIRNGQASRVLGLCRKLNYKKIPREFLLDYAQIARRSGAPDLIVLWLHPIVRPTTLNSPKATDAERAMYALGLQRLGALKESEKILNSVNPEKDPQIYFYRASLFFNQWDYSKALPSLRKYVRHPNVVPYSKLVGRLNICSALVSLRRLDQAQTEIESLLKAFDRGQHSLLKGNLLETRSQLFYWQGDWSKALADLEAAAELLKKADERSLLYVKKWKLLVKAASTLGKPNNLRKHFDELRETAQRIKDWETLRDCDLHQAQILNDKDLLLKVYWGSKFPAYKKRVLKDFPRSDQMQKQIQDQWAWLTHGHGAHQKLDLVARAPSKILRLLFFALLSELYQPVRSTEILDVIYPNDYFHPISSSIKLHRLMARARKWLADEKIPIQILSLRNSFKLHFLKPLEIILHREMPKVLKLSVPNWAGVETKFSTQDWVFRQGVSERTARRQIQYLLENKKIQRLGLGPQTRYRAL